MASTFIDSQVMKTLTSNLIIQTDVNLNELATEH